MNSEAPKTFNDLVELLQARRTNLSPSHRLLAERVMADPEGVAFMTVYDLAGAMGINEATVVRFATGLGLKGFPELKRLCGQRLREQAQLVHRFDNLEQHTAEDGNLRERLAALDTANIARTFAHIDRPSWDATAKALAEAPRVHIMGLRLCHAPAYLLAYLLGLQREDVETITTGAGTLTDALRRIREGDTFVAVAFHRYSADTVRATEWANKRGARCVALTDNPASPLVPPATHTFFIDAAGVSVMRSVTAFTALVQALAAEVAQLQGETTRETLADVEELLTRFRVYSD